MKSLRTVGALWLAVVLLVGCGKSDSSNKELNLNSFAAQAADTVCSAMVQCSCTDASALQDCKTAYREMVTLEASMMLLEYPGMKLDPAAAQTCLDDIRTQLSGCSAPAPGENDSFFTQSCQDMFVGAQAQGERCSWPEDCAPGLGCDRRDYTCAPRVALDGDCEFIECQDGLACTSGTCTNRAAAGEDCSTVTCQEGLSCVWVASSSRNECVAPHEPDADCSDNARCVAGLYCDLAGTQTCKALVADGGNCTSDSQCLHGSCNSYDGTCRDPGICQMMGGPR